MILIDNSRFITDINDFKDPEKNIVVGNKKRLLKQYLEIGTKVKLYSYNNVLTIIDRIPVFDGKVYDYKGITNINNKEYIVYFNTGDIEQLDEYKMKEGEKINERCNNR